jgi:hypothetical protein
MPQRGDGLQPRVATLGMGKGMVLNRKAVASFASEKSAKAGATAVRLKD